MDQDWMTNLLEGYYGVDPRELPDYDPNLTWSEVEEKW